MKGMIFTEFLEMVEDKFGLETVDHILNTADDPEDGAYSSVGTYAHVQLVNLVVELHKKTGIPLRDLCLVYGRHLFGQLAKSYPHFLEGVDNAFSLLVEIELLIHTEVRKLYPEANPPKFEGEMLDDNTLKLVYHSHRSLGDVAEGLIMGCGDYFGETFSIAQTALTENGQQVEFIIKRT